MQMNYLVMYIYIYKTTCTDVPKSDVFLILLLLKYSITTDTLYLEASVTILLL